MHTTQCGCPACSQKPPEPRPPRPWPEMCKPPRPPVCDCRPPKAEGVLLQKIICCEKRDIPRLCTQLTLTGFARSRRSALYGYSKAAPNPGGRRWTAVPALPAGCRYAFPFPYAHRYAIAPDRRTMPPALWMWKPTFACPDATFGSTACILCRMCGSAARSATRKAAPSRFSFKFCLRCICFGPSPA